MSTRSSRQGMLESSPDSVGQYGRSSTERLQASFPGSPVLLGRTDKISSFTRNGVRAWYAGNVLRGKRNDGGHTFGTFDMDYSAAPDYDEVMTGGEGLPASPWFPNPTSPGEGNGVNPANQAEAGEGVTSREASSTPFAGEGSTLSPDSSSKQTVARTLRDFLTRGL